jgi:hypothetical protein
MFEVIYSIFSKHVLSWKRGHASATALQHSCVRTEAVPVGGQYVYDCTTNIHWIVGA